MTNNIPAHFELYKDAKGEWRWRLISAGNSKVIADSGEGYVARADCVRGLRLVAGIASTTHIWDVAAGKWVDA